MSSALTPIAPKLRKLILLLSSDKGGEVVAAAAAIGRTLPEAGANWHDLADALTVPRTALPIMPARPTHGDLLAMASEVVGHTDLSAWEADFSVGVYDLLRRGRPLSRKQRRALTRIWERLAA